MMTPEKAERVINELGSWMENFANEYGTTPFLDSLVVLDESVLPYPKSVAKEAILVFLKITEDPAQRDLLKLVYPGLAYFRPNVGKKPIGLLYLGNEDLPKYTKEELQYNPKILEEAQLKAKTLLEQSEKFKSFESEIKKEEAQLKAELAEVEKNQEKRNKNPKELESHSSSQKTYGLFAKIIDFLSGVFLFLAGTLFFSIGIFFLYQIVADDDASIGVYIFLSSIFLIVGSFLFLLMWIYFKRIKEH